jgi:hypothetical protein
MEDTNVEEEGGRIRVYHENKDTILKTSKELIEEIKELCVNFEEDECLMLFYRRLCSLKDDIKANISSELYDKFDIEYKCVYYENLYGDGTFSEHVVKDCMDCLDEIIDTLILKD